MARWSKTLTPEAQAAFLSAIRGGALVEAAAKAAGVAISTLYWRRRRDGDFADAWEAAVEASTRPVLLRSPGKGLRLGRTRRSRFDACRRAAFLDHLALTCHTKEAAEHAGVHVSTVYRHIRRDPEFARDNKAALQRGYARLERVLAKERAEAPARSRARAWVPTGEPTADFDEAMKLLARWDRPDGSIGPRFVRYSRMKPACSFEDAIAALEKRLRNLGIPIEYEEAGAE